MVTDRDLEWGRDMALMRLTDEERHCRHVEMSLAFTVGEKEELEREIARVDEAIRMTTKSFVMAVLSGLRGKMAATLEEKSQLADTFAREIVKANDRIENRKRYIQGIDAQLSKSEETAGEDKTDDADR